MDSELGSYDMDTYEDSICHECGRELENCVCEDKDKQSTYPNY